MPYNLKDPVRHKIEKQHYNKRDWKAYDQSLQNRGNLTIWFQGDVISKWNAQPQDVRKPGRQRKYSELAIEASLTVRLVFKQALRQTEGLMKSIVNIMGLDLDIPDHTTISRRSQKLSLSAKKASAAISEKGHVLIVDSTGLKVVGEKEWMNTKHGTKQRKVWRKLHLVINETGEILDSTLTTHDLSDVSQLPDLLENIDEPIDELIGDSGGYDHKLTYETIAAHELKTGQSNSIRVIIPPNLGFQKRSDSDPTERLDNIDFIAEHGREKWQKKTDYGRRSLVENTMYRYKTIIGRTLRSKNDNNQNTEVKIGIAILNTMKDLGIPKARKAA